MIWVRRLNGERFVVNSDQIEFIEETPDTVVSLQSGRKIVVMESADEMIDRIIEFRRLAQVAPRETLLRPDEFER